MQLTDLKTDIVIAGGGPVALAAALECAHQGFDIIILAPDGSHVQSDARTTALMMPSIKMLKKYGVWADCKAKSAPLRILRMIDDTKRLVRAPSIDFHASEIDEDAFGYNIPNQVLTQALRAAIDKNHNVTVLPNLVSGARDETDSAIVSLDDGRMIKAQLVVGADGVHSIVRQSAGIDVKQWDYPQTALVMAFDHSRPHDDISTEFHTPFGPFTQVPLPGNRSSLVWVKTPEDAALFSEMPENELCGQVEKQMQSMLGKISNPTKAQAWPLSSSLALKFAATRIVLLGQAAHAFPPIGAQGLNLSFRDVADLGSALLNVDSRSDGDIGASAITQTYDRKRRADIYVRTGAVDALNRSLLGGFLPLQMARAAGLSVLKNVGPFRNFLMREGFKPGSSFSDFFKKTQDAHSPNHRSEWQ